MIINKTLVSFAGRVPSPRYVPVGVVGDNLVECIEFRLPTIDDEQTATILLKGRYADAIILKRINGVLYCVDITAEIAGESGQIEAYIRIDGASGATWNSEKFFLCICDAPNIVGDIENRNPTAFEQTLSAIAECNAAMKQHGEAMQEASESIAESAESAIDSAKRAEALVTIGPEYAGMLLFVDQTGEVAPVRLGDGLEIKDGALIVTGTGAVIAGVTVDEAGNAVITGATLTVDADGNGTLTGGTLTVDEEGNAVLA